MRVASILCSDLFIAKTQIDDSLQCCDAIELRLDYLKKIDIIALKTLRQQMTVPVIFTLRKRSQGGLCNLPEMQRLEMVHTLATLAPDYLDLEFDTPSEWVGALKKKYPAIQIIGSYHDFQQTPDDLETLFHRIHQPYFDIVKIATFANNICDTLRFLIFLKKISRQHRATGMVMGEYGQASRILAPVVGSLMTYGSVDANFATAPGQLTLQEMTDIYHVHLLNHNTAIYALLGDPITQSPGHLFHNNAFAQKRKNAVYVKLKVAPGLLAEAIPLFKQLPFDGFSITIPHKETIAAFLNELHEDAKSTKAVNTVKNQNGKYLGFNTDGIASVDVLENKITLADKKILILGAGGSANAITHSLSSKGAKITLCNRTIARAQSLAKKYNGDAMDFAQLLRLEKLPYDVIINTLPADAFIAQCAHWKMPQAMHVHSIAMDIVLKPLDTLFLQSARTAGYDCIAGDALFRAQALRQLAIWL